MPKAKISSAADRKIKRLEKRIAKLEGRIERSKKHEATYLTLLKHLPQKVFLKDNHSNYIACNESYAKDLKISAADIAGKTDNDFFPRELADKYRADDARIMITGRTVELDEAYVKDGSQKTIHLVKTPIVDDDGTVHGILGIFWDAANEDEKSDSLREDHELLEYRHEARSADLAIAVRKLKTEIAERKKAQEALVLFRHLVDHSNDCVFVFHPRSGVVVDVNDQSCETLNFTRSELLSTYIYDFDMAIPDIGAWHERVNELRERTSLVFESSYVSKNGTSISVEVSAKYIEHDHTAYVIAIVRDVTECRQEQGRLRKAEAMLAQSEKLASLGQMASGLAHEFKNPLDIVLQGIDYLRDQVGSANPQLVDVGNRIKTAVLRADNIIHGLLDFSRKTPFERMPHPANELIKIALDLVEKQRSLENITITLELAENLAPVLVDRAQLELVFINVITNALKAMPKGGELIFRTRSIKLTTIGGRVGRRASDRFSPGESAVVCEIEDTGTGIPPEIIGKIFDPFFTTAQPGEGAGLGLAITRTLVELNGGFITLSTEAGKGTLIRATLPIAVAEERRRGR